MGFLKKLKSGEKKRQKELEEKVEEFRSKVAELGRNYGMSIVPIMTKYGMEFEIQVLSDREKEGIDKKEMEKGQSESLAKKI